MSVTPPSKEYRDLYRAGVEAARARDFERARRLFQAAVTLDEGQKRGWLALARLESDPQAKAEYYRRVLRLDPKDAAARAFIEGMRQARWYHSRRVVGLLGLVALLLGVVAVLLARPDGAESDQVLPTSAQFPTATPTGEMQTAPLSADTTTEMSVVTEEAAAQTETIIAPQVTLFSSSDSTQIFLAAPTASATVPGFVPTATPPPPTAVFVPPTVSAPTVTPGSIVVGTLVTAAPTSASSSPPTEQPLFMDITPPGPTSTGLPVFITPTDESPASFNTDVPPPDAPVIEDPNSGGGGPRP